MDALLFSRYAIIVLTIAVVILPLRYAFMAILLLGYFDASGPGFLSATHVGVVNALKVLGAPLLLLARLRFRPLRMVSRFREHNFLIYVFVVFVVYIGVAIFWSEWKLSGFKMLGYSVGYLLWFLVLAYGWFTGRITYRTILWVFVGGSLLGILQSDLLNPVFGISRFSGQRFTAFLAPQYYAAFIVFVTMALLFINPSFFRSVLILVVSMVLVVLNGSRYSFLGLLFGIGVFFGFNLQRREAHSFTLVLIWSLTVFVGIMILMEGFGVSFSFPRWFQQSRIAELSYVFSNPENIGTLAWRIGIYKAVAYEISKSQLQNIVFGHGTSSGTDVALEIDPRYSVQAIDANRVLHNEFVRSLYEWGIIGFLLLVMIIIGLGYGAVTATISGKKIQGYALLAALPLLISGLMIENILAGAGSGWGIGITLLLSGAWVEASLGSIEFLKGKQ